MDADVMVLVMGAVIVLLVAVVGWAMTLLGASVPKSFVERAQEGHTAGQQELLAFVERAQQTRSPIDDVIARALLDAWNQGGQMVEDISGVDVVPGRPDIDPDDPGVPDDPPVVRVLNDNPMLMGQPVAATVDTGPDGKRYQVAPPGYAPLIQAGSRQTPPYINGESGVYKVELFAIDGNFGFKLDRALDLPAGRYEMVIDCEVQASWTGGGSAADMSIGVALAGDTHEMRPPEQSVVVGARHRYVFGLDLPEARTVTPQWFVVVRWATAAEESKAIIRALEISRIL